METIPTPALPSAWKILKQSLSFYGSNFRLILAIAGIPLILGILSLLLKMPLGATIVFSIVTAFISFVSYLGLFQAATGNAHTVGTAYRMGLSVFFPFLWVSILSGIVVIPGYLLFIVPGIILSVLLCQDLYVLFTEQKRGVAALVQSWHYVRGRIWAVLGRYAFLILMAILAGLVFGSVIYSVLGDSRVRPVFEESFKSLVFTPLGIIYGYFLFVGLRATKTEILGEEEERRLKKKISAWAIAGLVVIGGLLLLAGTQIMNSLPEIREQIEKLRLNPAVLQD